MAVRLQPSKKFLDRVAETLVPAASKKLILQSLSPELIVTYYLAVNDMIICWSEDRGEIEAAYEGRFNFGFEPVPSRDAQLAERIMERQNREAAEYRAAQERKFRRRIERTRARVAEMLRAGAPDYRTRVGEFAALKTLLGITTLVQIKHQSQLNRVSALIGSWVLKERATLG